MSATLYDLKSSDNIQMSSGSWMDLLSWGVMAPAGVVVRGDKIIYYYERLGNPTDGSMVVKNIQMARACGLAASGVLHAIEEGDRNHRAWVGERERISSVNLKGVIDFFKTCKGFRVQ